VDSLNYSFASCLYVLVKKSHAILGLIVGFVLVFSIVYASSYRSNSASPALAASGSDNNLSLSSSKSDAPSEDELDNLTTFELLAKYPSLDTSPNKTSSTTEAATPAAQANNNTQLSSSNNTQLAIGNESSSNNTSSTNASSMTNNTSLAGNPHPNNVTTTSGVAEQNRSGIDLVFTHSKRITGEIKDGDYSLLEDLMPYATTEHGHITIKLPCDNEGDPPLKVVVAAGENSQNFTEVKIGKAMAKATLASADNNNTKEIKLSDKGEHCLYSTELPEGTTEILLLNDSGHKVKFSDGRYYVAVTAHALLKQQSE
jgi:hypothetical protein